MNFYSASRVTVAIRIRIGLFNLLTSCAGNESRDSAVSREESRVHLFYADMYTDALKPWETFLNARFAERVRFTYIELYNYSINV